MLTCPLTRVFHYQLDLFDPDNGTWEYSAVATNLGFDVRRLWRFMLEV